MTHLKILNSVRSTTSLEPYSEITYVKNYKSKMFQVYSYNKSQHDAPFLNFILVKNSACFGQTYCPSSEVLILYSQQLVFVILVMLTVC
jgi:hypothetical protein